MNIIRACILFFLSVAAVFSASAHALPVIPGASGFGIETPAGRGGRIFVVSSLADNGPGTLRECVSASGPRICVFEVSGVIRLSSDLSVTNPNLTIAGQTAPSPGIMLRGAGLGIHASDVLVQHIVVRSGDDPGGPDPNLRSALMIDSGNSERWIRNIVIDHCSFSWAPGKNLVIWNQFDDISLLNSMFSEPLRESPSAPSNSVSFNAITGATNGRVSFIGNLFAHFQDRAPLTLNQSMVFANNVAYNYWSGTDFQNRSGIATLNSVVGNVYIRGQDSRSSTWDVLLNGGQYGPVIRGTKLHVRDNVGTQPNGNSLSSDPWSIVRNDSGLSRSEVEALSPPVWPQGLVARSAADGGVLDFVLSTVGARPAERNSVDERVINSVRNGSGRIIDCVSSDGTTRCAMNGGGWPEYAQNYRRLDLPTDPHVDGNGDGYSNIESFLHEMAAVVEGRSNSTTAPKAPMTTVE